MSSSSISDNLQTVFEDIDEADQKINNALKGLLLIRHDIDKIEKSKQQSQMDILLKACKYLKEVREESPEMTLCDAIEYIGDTYEQMKDNYMESETNPEEFRE